MGKKNKNKHNNHQHNQQQPADKPGMGFAKLQQHSSENTPSQNEEVILTPEQMSRGRIIGGVAAAVVILVILLIIFIPGKRGDDASTGDMMDETAQDVVATEFFGTQTRSMQPVEDGEFIYRFDGITWMLEADDEAGVGIPVTRVNWMFENFSRRESGTPVTFGEPYKMGAVQGECQAVDELPYDIETETGIPLAYATCEMADGESTTEYAIFQEGELVVVKKRMYETFEDAGNFEVISTKNMTEIVS